MSAPPATEARSAPAGGSPRPARLLSLDVLRGFDMFWITGGAAFLRVLGGEGAPAALQALARQTRHVPWDGFRLWDLVFPLFLFLAGVGLPFSIAGRRSRGASSAALHLHVVRRGLLLVLLGLVYNGLFRVDLSELRVASVLGRIGLAWMFAALVFLHSGPRGQALWSVGLLVGYAAALLLVPVPGFGAGNLAPGATLTDHVDRLLLPGRLLRGDRDPEGLLSTLPAIATALSGALAGHWLRGTRGGRAKVLGLVGAGLAGLALGALLHPWLPINKNLWSSSFVLWTSGASALLLGISYLLVDVLGWRRGTFFFVVIGANPITIYMLERFVDWTALARWLHAGAALPLLWYAAVGVGLRWVLLYALYRRRIFLRI